MSFVNIRDKTYKVKKNLLNLRNKRITSFDEISGLNNLPFLTQMDLSNNNITEIKGLDNFPNLVHLDLSNNAITDIKGLQNLPNLVFLDLSGNNITQITGLENLKRLRILKLNRNVIREITGLDSLKDLMTLFLEQNQINEITGLENIHKLNAIYLNGNYISDIKGVEHLRNLKRLDIGKVGEIPREQIKEVQKAGVFTKDQRYYESKALRIFIWLLISAIVCDLIISAIIVAGFQWGIQAFWPMFGTLLIPFLIGVPIIYCIAKEEDWR